MRISFGHKSPQILMNCTAQPQPASALARSFVLAKLLIAAKLRDSL